MTGIAETKDVLTLVLSTIDVIKKANEDGSINMGDIGLLVGLLPKLGPAFSGIDQVPAELKDLSQPEQTELINHVMTHLPYTEPKTRDIVEKSLVIIAHAYGLYKIIKEDVTTEG